VIISTGDEREEQMYAAVIMRVMAAMVKNAGGELIVTEADLIETTFMRLALEMLADGSARMYLRQDEEPRGTAQ
jgi:hypothetical protein